MEFACFVRISEQIANFALHNIKRSVFITEVVCLLRGTHRVLIQHIHFVFKNLPQSTVRQKYAAAAAGVVVPILHSSDFNAHNVT
jgi:hypothetical protein